MGFMDKIWGQKVEPGSLGLALGGGAVLGAAHVGVLKALQELELKIDYVAGTSVGAIIGSFFAFGKDWKEIKEIIMELNWLEVSGLSLSQYGLLSGEKLGQRIEQELGDVTMEQAKIHLAVVATDIATGEKVVLESGKVATAVRASACIPGAFIPVEIDGRMLVDGGIVENVPVSTVRDLGAKQVIAVNLQSKRGKPDNIIELLVNAFQFSINHATKLQMQEAEFLLDLELSHFNRFDPKQIPDLIEAGYRQAIKDLSRIEERGSGK